ncbi:MAG: cupredoxin domain-containing protein [Nanoarchaeota archaeon]|nr:cupredoxin domain-containing protein [Nanoarchaeota archaeon]
MKKEILIVVVVVIVFGFLAWTMLSGQSNGSDVANSGSDDVIVETGETKTYDIIAKQWEFEPATIEVNLGDKVVMNVESKDVTHGISIPQFGVSERLNPGDDVHVEFVANKKGTFSFFCNVPCGSEHRSMQGMLIVN